MQIYLSDRRRPASLTVLRWGVNPNLAPGSEPEALRLRGLSATRFEGRLAYWHARVVLPLDEPSYLVVRVSWRDPDDCAAGPDRLAAGVAFAPL